MKTKPLVFFLATALALPVLAEARPVVFATELSTYNGDGAYVALYLTDANGLYKQTLWIAGEKAKYYKHLGDWARGSRMRRAEYDGMTGASVHSGQTLRVTIDLDDALIDAGYQVHIDTSVEDMRDHRSEVVAPLTTEGAGKPIAGKGYVKSLTYTF
ncbi:MAG: DUF2271 domain-containing protein [Thiohalobacteraceae bacterium]|nr:DUF2271 domain-containing protein [Gammaproteobacteria bacterium]